MTDSSMSGIPGVGAMADTLEFVKNLWGGMKIPGMAMPSLSVDDVNKQIADLKAVESWLNVNMSMLRSTIQALEVQSATLAALQTMSNSMNSLAQAGMTQPAVHGGNAAPPAAGTFSFTSSPAGTPSAPAPADASNPQPQSEPPQANADMGNATAFANPAAWWSLLQDQFKQAVNTAVATEPREEKKTEPEKAKAKPRARKTAAKKRAPKA